jgi:hypothetical protein
MKTHERDRLLEYINTAREMLAEAESRLLKAKYWVRQVEGHLEHTKAEPDEP